MTLDSPSSAMVWGSAPAKLVGNVSEPTPMMAPWPGMRRGTERSVPMVPGLVRVTVTPAKSSTVNLLVLALRTSSS